MADDRSPDRQASAGSRRTPADPSLLLDVMLGKLATYLRMCGYDAAYALDREVPSASDASGEEGETPQASRSASGERRPASSDEPRGIEADDALLDLARSEDRLLVTRDAELARRVDGLLLESLDANDQLRELADAGFELELAEPGRCATCNGELVPVAEEDPTPEYAPDTGEMQVWRCPDCGQHFWEGSHWESVAETLAEL